jgi:CubicO group peptidase (beta-lactamase class C family)
MVFFISNSTHTLNTKNEIIHSDYPRIDWETKLPSEVGMDAEKLNQIKGYMGGSGVIVRHGYIIKSWGDSSTRKDIASAAKPFYSHFLAVAVEEEKLISFHEKVSDYQMCVNEINSDLGYKDKDITLHHMVNQISAYGVSEEPGTAFNYNDWQMALFWDTLFLEVYSATYENVDEMIFDPYLNKILQMQDNPTMMAFGADDRQGRIAISIRDLARFGLLYLNGGNWDGNQVLAKEYVDRMTKCPIPDGIPRTEAIESAMCLDQRSLGSLMIPDDQFDHQGSYSWLWWVNGVEIDAYAALGHSSKRGLAIIPSLDVVIAWNGTKLDQYPSNPHPLNEILKLIQESVSTSPKNFPASQGKDLPISNSANTCGYPFRVLLPLLTK